MEKNAILAFVLALIVLIGWQYLFIKRHPIKRKPPEGRQQPPIVEKKQKPLIEEGLYKQRPTPSAPAPLDKEKIITVETDLYTARFSSIGAVLLSWKLKNYRETVDKDSPLIDLVKAPKYKHMPLSLYLPGFSLQEDPNLSNFQVDRQQLFLSGPGQKGSLRFSWRSKGGIRIEKSYVFYSDRYSLDMEVSIFDESGLYPSGQVGIEWSHQWDPGEKRNRWQGSLGPVALINENIKKVDAEDVKRDTLLSGDIEWAGFQTKYFLASMIPMKKKNLRLRMSNLDNLILVTLFYTNSTTQPAKAPLDVPFRFYLGPKEIGQLKKTGFHLDKAINFGFFNFIAKPLHAALIFINKFVKNFGVSIIIVTIFVNILFWPLKTKSYKSMKEMQRVQPRIQQIRQRFKNDKEQLNRELMQLYRTHKINPLGGCLPMIIQIPVFFALYYTLMGAIELRHAPFLFWIRDLSSKDPYYITPLIMGASMVIQQKMTPTAGDPMQAKIMMLMPIFFTFLFLNFPSGLVLYWLVNNILSIGQQIYINRYTT